MELMFVALIAAGIGFIANYTLPARDTRGDVLLAAVGVVVAAIVWVGLLWLGFTFDGGWIWAISIVAAGLASLAVGLALPRTRRSSDRALLTQLSAGKA